MTESLGELLTAAGLVSEAELREGLAHQRNRGVGIGEALVQLGHVDETSLARVVAKQQGMPFVDLGKGRIPDHVLEHVPAEVAIEQSLVPVKKTDTALIVAIDDPLKRIVADQLSFVFAT